MSEVTSNGEEIRVHTQHVLAQGVLVFKFHLVYSSSEASTGTLLTMLESLQEAIQAESLLINTSKQAT